MIFKRTVHPACSVVQLQPAEMSISIDFIDFAIHITSVAIGSLPCKKLRSTPNWCATFIREVFVTYHVAHSVM